MEIRRVIDVEMIKQAGATLLIVLKKQAIVIPVAITLLLLLTFFKIVNFNNQEARVKNQTFGIVFSSKSSYARAKLVPHTSWVGLALETSISSSNG